ncbi:MAG: spermidine synthase [Candidatus Micrarchaeia archaeon]
MRFMSSIEALIRGKLVASISEQNAYIEVRERNGERTLFYNGITFSRIRKDSLFTNGYWDYFMPLPLAFENAKVLLIGLGGGTVPYQLETLYHDISIDVIEIDPNMVSMSKVMLPRSLRANIIIGDGAQYIKNVSNEYDIIILDTYLNAKIPGAFLEEGFVQDAWKALRARGILAINYALTIDNIPYFETYIRKLGGYFDVGVVSAYNLGNRIIVCEKGMKREELGKVLERFGNKKIANDYISMKTL